MWQEQGLRGIHPDIEPAGAGLVVGTLTGKSEERGGMVVAVIRGMAVVGEVAVETEDVMIHPNFSHPHRTPSSSPYPTLHLWPSNHYH